MPSKIHRMLLGAFAWLPLATSGCGVSLGAATITDLHPHRSTQVAMTSSFRGHPGSSDGLVLGGGATVAPKLQNDSAWRAWGEGAVGYAIVPLAHTNPVGFEATAGPALGALPVSNRHPFSVGWSFRLAMPYRVSRSRSAWEIDSVTQSLAYLVPEAALVQMFPIASNLNHGAISQLLFSLSFRYDQWLSVMP